MSEFQSTMWTVIRGARDGNDEALSRFVNTYRPPVVNFCRRRGLEADAEDLAQEVFLRLIMDGVLQKADPARGRLRSLVLAVTKRVIGHHLERRSAAKRGGGQVHSLGDLDVAATPPDAAEFDRDWVAHLVARALDRLAQEYPHYQVAVRAFFLENKSYAEIAAATGKSEGDIKNHLHRGRQKLVELVRAEVRDYSASDDEYAEELRALSDTLLAHIFPREDRR